MTLGQKLRQLRQLEGELRGLGRELTQPSSSAAIKKELGRRHQPALSVAHRKGRAHATCRTTRAQLLAKFFKVHPGYLVSDPPGFHTELTSEVGAIEPTLDRWLRDGASRFAHDPALAAALERLATHAETRRCLILLGEMISMPGLIDRLSETLVPEEHEMNWPAIFLGCFVIGFVLSALSFAFGVVARARAHPVPWGPRATATSCTAATCTASARSTSRPSPRSSPGSAAPATC